MFYIYYLFIKILKKGAQVLYTNIFEITKSGDQSLSTFFAIKEEIRNVMILSIFTFDKDYVFINFP